MFRTNNIYRQMILTLIISSSKILNNRKNQLKNLKVDKKTVKVIVKSVELLILLKN